MLENFQTRHSVRKKELLVKLHKMQSRIKNKITNGSFAELTRRKQRQLILRLRRYSVQLERLGLSLKAGAAIGVLSLAISIANPVSAQVNLVERFDEDNPLDLSSFNYISFPTFVDIDNDGDLDAFVGVPDPNTYSGTVKYFKNTGTIDAPVFELVDATDSPTESINLSIIAVPTFVDIDNDGDQDLFVGAYDAVTYEGFVSYYKNEGTNEVPDFELQNDASNPLSNVSVPYITFPTFADIDGDGDMDAIIGEYYGTVSYYKNEGTEMVPNFELQNGADNPFAGVNASYFSTPDLADIDGDGDLDALIGAEEIGVIYMKNIGDNMNPNFEQQIGADNPFDGLTFDYYSTPAMADIDDDGDQDVFLGNYAGVIRYFENTIGVSLPAIENVCVDSEAQNGLGGGFPVGGVYSGPGVTDEGNGMNYAFDPAAAGPGLHTITYTFDGETGTTIVEVFAAPVVTVDILDTIFLVDGMLPTGVAGGGIPVGGVYSSANGDEVDDDGNGMTFSFNALASAGSTYVVIYTYTDANGCQNSAAIEVVLEDEPVSVDYLEAASLDIFPNPTSGVLNVSGLIAEEITVLDIRGRLLKKEINPGATLDLSDLANGIYFLKIKANEQIISTRIIKQ